MFSLPGLWPSLKDRNSSDNCWAKLSQAVSFKCFSVAKFYFYSIENSDMVWKCNMELCPPLDLGFAFLQVMHHKTLLSALTPFCSYDLTCLHIMPFSSQKFSLSLTVAIKLQRFMSCCCCCCYCFKNLLDSWITVTTKMSTALFFNFYLKWILCRYSFL